MVWEIGPNESVTVLAIEKNCNKLLTSFNLRINMNSEVNS